MFQIINDYKYEKSDRDNLIIKAFVNYCIKKLNIQNDHFNIMLLGKSNDQNITTGGYDRADNVYARCEDRAVIDVLRTIAHELVHMMQMERGDFTLDSEVQDVGGVIEDEANAVAGQLIKSFKNDYSCEWIYSI